MFKEYSAFKVNSQWRDYTKLDLDHKSLSFLAFLFILHNKRDSYESGTKSVVLSATKTAHLPYNAHNPLMTTLENVWKRKDLICVMTSSGNRLSHCPKLGNHFFSIHTYS